MNRRKQRQPKRSSCCCQTTKCSFCCSSGQRKLFWPAISEAGSTDRSPPPPSSPPPSVDLDGEEDSCGAPEEVEKTTEYFDSILNYFENVKRRSSPLESSEYTSGDHSSSPPPPPPPPAIHLTSSAGNNENGKTTDVGKENGRSEAGATDHPLLAGGPSPPPLASLSGSGEGFSSPGDSSSRSVIRNAVSCDLPSVNRSDSSSSTGRGGVKQDFVRQLESFVASMDKIEFIRSNKIKTPAKIHGRHDEDANLHPTQHQQHHLPSLASPDQPLDLSVNFSVDKLDVRKRFRCPGDTGTSKTESGSAVNCSGASCSGASSLLESLEQRFGKHSQILGRVRSLPNASEFRGLHSLHRQSSVLCPSKLSELGEQASGGYRKHFSFPTAGNSFLSKEENLTNWKEKSGRNERSGRTLFDHQTTNEERRTTSAGNEEVEVASIEESIESKDQKKSNGKLRCSSCEREFDDPNHLTVHLQETGHDSGGCGGGCQGARSVRGQDQRLSSAGGPPPPRRRETRLIVRCMQCQRSFRSLPQLTIHMIQTEHYMNLVRPQLLGSVMRTTTTRRLLCSSGEEETTTREQPNCLFCSRTFDDEDALGLHIVTYGHHQHRRHRKQRHDDDTSSLPVLSSTATNNQKEGGRRGGGGGGGGGGRGVEAVIASDVNTETLESDEIILVKNSNIEVMRKIRRLDPDPSPPPPSLSLSNAPVHLPTPAEDDDVCHPLTKQTTAKAEADESALTAMQTFICRSLGQMQTTTTTTNPRTGGAGAGGRGGEGPVERRQTTKRSSWQPVSGLLTPQCHHKRPPTSGQWREEGGLGGPPREEAMFRADDDEEEAASSRGSGSDPPPSSAAEELLWKKRRWKSCRRFHRIRVEGRARMPNSNGGCDCVGSVAPPPPSVRDTPPLPGGRSPVTPSPAPRSHSGTFGSSLSNEREEKKKRRQQNRSNIESLEELVYTKTPNELEATGRSPSSSSGSDQLTKKKSQEALFASSSPRSIPDAVVLASPSVMTVIPDDDGGGGGSAVTPSTGTERSRSARGSSSPASDEDLLAGVRWPPPVMMDYSPSFHLKEEVLLSSSPSTEFNCRRLRLFPSKETHRCISSSSRRHGYTDADDTRTTKVTADLCSSLLTHDPTNRFSKYYQLANELSGKS